jgi:hypothetical protein
MLDGSATLRGGTAVAGPVLCDPSLNFATPQLKKMLAVWEAKRGERALPSRGDFGLRDLSFVLPHIALLSIVRAADRLRFRVRLEGSELDAHAGPMTGLYIDETVPKKFSDKWSAPWLLAANTGKPMRSVGRVEFRDRNYYVSESFTAPLGADGATPDMLLLGVYYHLSDGDPASQGEIAGALVREFAAAL